MGGDTIIGGQTFRGGITYANIEALNIHLGTGNDTFTIESTHEGSTTVTGGRGNDTITVKTVSGHTTIEGDEGDDKVIVRNDEGTVDQIAGLLTIDTGAGNDVVTVDDAADTNDNTGTLTGSTLIGLDMPTSPLMQVIFIQAVGGRFRLAAHGHALVRRARAVGHRRPGRGRAAHAVRHAGPQGRRGPAGGQRHLHRHLHARGRRPELPGAGLHRHSAWSPPPTTPSRSTPPCCRARSPAASSRR